MNTGPVVTDWLWMPSDERLKHPPREQRWDWTKWKFKVLERNMRVRARTVAPKVFGCGRNTMRKSCNIPCECGTADPWDESGDFSLEDILN